MTDDILHPGRPYDSGAIIWNSRLNCCISPITFDNRQVWAVKAAIDDLLILTVNVYMLSDSSSINAQSNHEYVSVLNDVAVLAHIAGIDEIILGGDLRTDLKIPLTSRKCFATIC